MKFAGDRLRLSASDVANFVACQHMTRLDLLEARGALHRPREFDLGFQDLVKRAIPATSRQCWTSSALTAAPSRR